MAYKRKAKTLEDAYRYFKKENDIEISKQKYKEICKDFNLLLVEKILKESYEFRVPYRLGRIRIRARKMSFNQKSKLKLDYKKTKELGKPVYHLNNHTNNYSYGWWWNKDLAIVKNKGLYIFKPTRTNTRTLASLILGGKTDYFT